METKRIFRLRSNKIIAGVCAGLAEYLNVDASIVRVLFLFVTFFFGSGILLYLISWLIIPFKEDSKC